ncbi:short-chain dehydrogenase [Hymenopellis radicata]|nr:short-chain dehydrogenase [Hymenopellis radicata]
MVQRTWEAYYADQKKTPPPVAHADLTSKTVLVTGANIGLGFEACKHFARMNPARLILACRNVDKANAALAQLHANTGYGRGEVWEVDLSSFASVSAFADKADRELDRLDILVENAAIVNWGAFEYTNDGWETVLQTNYIGTALLALRLLPLLKKTAEQHSGLPRLVIVTSELFYSVDVPQMFLDSPNVLEAMNHPERCAPYTSTEKPEAPEAEDIHGDPQAHLAARYSHTKLLELFFVRSLQACVGSSIIVNCHMKEDYAKREEDMAYTTEEGSRQLVYAAVGGADNEKQLLGAFISLSEVREVSDYALSRAGRDAEDRIWKESLELLNTVDHKVGEIRQHYLQ